MRLIDAEETIKAIEEVKKIMNEEIIENDRKDLINFANGLNQACLCVEQQPTEERPKGKWIPVSERLPEKFQDVLCWAKSTARGGDICFVGSCDKGCWFLQSSEGHQSYPSQYKVVAWMELPEPYKEGEK